MIDLYSMSSFVQFLGAFHFANVYQPIQDKLFKFVLNVEEEFISRFDSIRGKIQADIQSVDSLSIIETKDGKSTKHSVESLKAEFDKLHHDFEAMKKETKTEVEERFKMSYSRPMFLTFGMYCTFELFVFGLLEMTGDDTLLSSFSAYNMIMILVLAYFILCELLIFKGIKWRFFNPTHRWMMLFSILAPMLCMANHYFVCNTEPVVRLSTGFVENMSLSCLLLSVIPFLVVILFTLFHYLTSVRLIKRNARRLSETHEKLHKQKQNLDNICKIFAVDDNQIYFGN